MCCGSSRVRRARVDSAQVGRDEDAYSRVASVRQSELSGARSLASCKTLAHFLEYVGRHELLATARCASCASLRWMHRRARSEPSAPSRTQTSTTTLTNPPSSLPNRLWFQLTSTIEAFISVPSSGPYQIELYEQFITDFSSKINQLKLVSIGISVARQFSGTFFLPSSLLLAPRSPRSVR